MFIGGAPTFNGGIRYQYLLSLSTLDFEIDVQP
jgi:hypothetical protein